MKGAIRFALSARARIGQADRRLVMSVEAPGSEGIG